MIWSKSSANKRNECVKCDNFTKGLLVITVTANSNKWQQALGFVSCAPMSKGLITQKALKEKASVDQPEKEYEQVMYMCVQIQVHRLWHLFLFLAAIPNTKSISKEDTPCAEK